MTNIDRLSPDSGFQDSGLHPLSPIGLITYPLIYSSHVEIGQTLHNVNYTYIMWMEQMDAVFPLVQEAIKP